MWLSGLPSAFSSFAWIVKERVVIEELAAHLDAIEPATDYGGQREESDGHERDNAMPREGRESMTSS